jgi:hypothetical protein
MWQRWEKQLQRKCPRLDGNGMQAIRHEMCKNSLQKFFFMVKWFAHLAGKTRLYQCPAMLLVSMLTRDAPPDGKPCNTIESGLGIEISRLSAQVCA